MRRGAYPGWDAGSARLEDRMLLSVTTAGSGVRVVESSFIGPLPAGVTRPVLLQTYAPAPVPETVFTASGSPSVDMGTPGDVVPATTWELVGSTTLAGASVAYSASWAGAPGSYDSSGPVLIGQPSTTTASGLDGPHLPRMEDSYLAYRPVDEAAMGILPSYPASYCASMASIIGAGDMEAVADAPAPTPPPVVVPGVVASLRPIEAMAVEAEPPGSIPGAGSEPAPTPAEAEPSPGAMPAGGEGGGDGEYDRIILPAPIGLGLRLAAPCFDPAAWDRAVARLVEGVDELLGEFEDLGADAPYLPWIVGAGLAVAASEAARKARPRPAFASPLVDAPVADPEGRLAGRIRGLLAGLRRWTTR